MTKKEKWVKVGSFGNSDILTKGNKRKLVNRDGKLSDFHYEFKKCQEVNGQLEIA